MSRPTGAVDSILDAIGGTPLVRLARLDADLGREIYLKLENLNPGGSHKVRIALNMVLDAEQRGELTRGSGQTIIESTGGNTGIGLAMVAAILGYRLLLVIPDNYSQSKQRLLTAYGAEVVLSDHTLGNNSHADMALTLLFDHPDWVMLNQQGNPANPEIHRRTTAVEILEGFGGAAPDGMIAGVGTGGHLTGVGSVLRRTRPDLRIAAVLPEGCSLRERTFVTHGIQGLAVGIVPAVLDTTLIDEELPVSYADAVAMMRRLLRTEAIAVGLSSAANLVATCRWASTFEPGARLLTFAYDGVGDYLDVLAD